MRLAPAGVCRCLFVPLHTCAEHSSPLCGAQVRQSAGLLLKNNLKDHYAATTEEFRKYIKVLHVP